MHTSWLLGNAPTSHYYINIDANGVPEVKIGFPSGSSRGAGVAATTRYPNSQLISRWCALTTDVRGEPEVEIGA